MNPLFQMLGQNNLMGRFRQFQQSFRGNPREQVEQMLRSGRVTQEQYNAAVQQAQNLLGKNQNLPF